METIQVLMRVIYIETIVYILGVTMLFLGLTQHLTKVIRLVNCIIAEKLKTVVMSLEPQLIPTRVARLNLFQLKVSHTLIILHNLVRLEIPEVFCFLQKGHNLFSPLLYMVSSSIFINYVIKYLQCYILCAYETCCAISWLY